MEALTLHLMHVSMIPEISLQIGLDRVLGGGQARFARVRQRTATAKAVRNAKTLARFWQTQGRLTWQDAAICSLFAASMAGIAQLWS